MILSSLAQAETTELNSVRAKLAKVTEKKDILFGYQSMYQDFHAGGPTYQDEAIISGFQLAYEHSYVYKVHWMLGYDVGAMLGTGTAGNSGAPYPATQASYSGLLAGIRALYRVHAFFDVGTRLGMTYKNLSFPTQSGLVADLGPNPNFNAYLEIRFHIGTEYDLVQSIGVEGTSKRTSWNIGWAYNL